VAIEEKQEVEVVKVFTKVHTSLDGKITSVFATKQEAVHCPIIGPISKRLAVRFPGEKRIYLLDERGFRF
jgi:hypothetical protein